MSCIAPIVTKRYCVHSSGHVLYKILNNSNEECTKRDKILFMTLVKQTCIFFTVPIFTKLKLAGQFFCTKLRDWISMKADQEFSCREDVTNWQVSVWVIWIVQHQMVRCLLRSVQAGWQLCDRWGQRLAGYNNKVKTDIRGRGVALECHGGSSYDGHVTSKGHNGTSNC